MYNDSLVKKTKELFKGIDETMDAMYKSAGGIEMFKNMGDEEALLFRRLLILMDTSKEYSMLMAKKLDRIDAIDEKLNKLLKRKEGV